ncbi:MAG TPA: sulfotransferase domain-containing protein [Kofleriaceae bacterium]
MSERGLPDFLVIGAMKCGTTTLYFDLDSQPAICMSTIKEPSVLVRLPDAEKAAAYYRRMFLVPPARSGEAPRRFGEASTLYSELPRHPGIPARARELLGRDLRFLYLVRNPVERAISHHYHELSFGNCGPDVDAVLRSDTTAVDFGRYAMQLEAWVDVFGQEAGLVIRFEDYVRARAATMEQVGTFLSVPIDASRIQADRAFNQSSEGRVPGRLRPLVRSDLYRLWLRRAIPERFRQRLRELITPAAPERPRRPRIDTIDYLIERLAPDAERLAGMLGWKAPIWDFEATRRKYAEPDETAQAGR